MHSGNLRLILFLLKVAEQQNLCSGHAQRSEDEINNTLKPLIRECLKDQWNSTAKKSKKTLIGSIFCSGSFFSN